VLRIGITGGIGSGKSTVLSIFAYLGVPCYQSDERAKWISNNAPQVKESIVKLLGSKSYNNNGLNRNYVSEIVFNNPQKLDALNQIIHPAVADDYESFCKQNANFPYTLKEAAILFESGSYKTLDKTIVVFADLEVRMQRVMHRSGKSRSEVASIIAAQMPDEEKMKLADFVIFNNLKELIIPQVLALHKLLINLKSI
jgi:dephospho-CoA kinase